MSTKNLNEKQKLFLEVLFEEAKGCPVTAKKLAGYSPTYSTTTLTSALAEEISELTHKFIAQSSTKAAYTMFDVMGTDDLLGAKERMAAAKDIMDRAGFVKTEKVEVKTEIPLFILPAKNT